jgi:DNA-binding SARP family transcriptional activator
MEVRILGPLEAEHNGMTFTPTAPKARQVLAILAAASGSVVTVGTIMDELWGDDLPPSAATTLQTYILQLRARIRGTLNGAPDGHTVQSPKEILARHQNGYVLREIGGHCDAQKFEQLARAGLKSYDQGDKAVAAEHMRSALALWRGAALVDIYTGNPLSAVRVRLDELRETCHDVQIEADMALGHHHAIMAELAARCTHDPTNERAHAQLMLALYRAGRRIAAVEVFHRLRDAMSSALGLDPSPTIHRLFSDILAADTRLNDVDLPQQGPATQRTPTGEGVRVPRRLVGVSAG